MHPDFRARRVPSHIVASTSTGDLHAYALTSIRNALDALQRLQARGVVSATPVCDAEALARMVDNVELFDDDDAPDALQDAPRTPARDARRVRDCLSSLAQYLRAEAQNARNCIDAIDRDPTRPVDVDAIASSIDGAALQFRDALQATTTTPDAPQVLDVLQDAPHALQA